MKKMLWSVLVLMLVSAQFASAAEELKILSATPQGNLNALDDGKAITLTFDRPVIALSGVEKDVREGPISMTPAVKGVYRWMGTSTLSFIPDTPLAYATRYVVNVKAPITAVDGAVLAKPFNFSFVTPRPQVTEVYPYQEQTQVTLEQPIFLKFNQPIDPKKAANFVSLTSEAGKEVPVMASYAEPEDVERQTPYWLQKDDVTVLKILPQQKLAQETNYQLRLKAGLPGKVGTLGMQQTYELKFRTYNYFRAENIQPGSYDCAEYYPEYGVVLVFSNAVKRDDVLKHLQVSPPVDMKLAEEEYSYETSELYLDLGFQPNTKYTLTLDPALQDIYGNTLGKKAVFKFDAVDYAPYVEMPSGRMIAEAYLGTRFPVKVMNVYEAPLSMKAYRTPEDLLKAAKMMGEYNFEVVEPDVERVYQPDILKNKLATMPFDLSEVLHEGETTGTIGMRLEFTTCRGDTQMYDALIFLTNLSVSAKFSGDNNLFWVTQLKDSMPVANAEVELYDENQKFLWKGATDNNGFVETPGWKELGLKATDTWNQPWVFAIVRSGADQLVIHSRDGMGISPYRFDISYSPDSGHLTADGYVFTERGIYRPGDDVQIVGMVRDKSKGQFVIPAGMDVEVKITDPNGKDLYKQPAKLSEFGSFHFPFKLPENAKIGDYVITCTFPLPKHLKLSKDDLEWYSSAVTGSFKVETYRPVEFEVKVNLPQDEYIKGDTLAAKVNAAYLFGGAVRDVPVEWNLNRTTYDFAPKGDSFAGYAFTVYDDDHREYQSQVAQKKEKLDQNGVYALEQPLTDTVSGSFTYSLDATVTDVNQRMVSSRKEFVVHGGEYYIGLKPQNFFATAGQNFAIKTLALTPDEKLLAGQNYQVTVKRLWWESVRRAGNGGRLYWESEQKEEVVQEFQAKSQAEPIDLTLPITKVGYYKVEAKGTDNRGNEIRSEDYFYAIGSGYAAWMRSDDDYVELVREKETYQPGDTANIMVKSPYEHVKALVTIEREGVIDRWIEDIEGSADTIAIPVKPEYIPNIYVGVILIQERVAYDKIEGELDLGKPGYKVGYTGLKVNPAERHIKVNLSTNQEEYRPGNEVEVQLQVVDQQGQGQEAEVVLSVVDVGVLNLIGYATPDPFDYFYRERPLAVLTSELRNSIVGQRNYSEKGERASGGGVDAAAMLKMIELRGKFKATAYHKPDIRTDANGRATVKFTLPDNLTAFRIMATAHTKTSLFGAGEKRITVNKKLMLTSSLPSFLRIGDTIQAGVVAHNRTDEDGKLTLQTETDGVVLGSENIQEVALPKQDGKEVRFNYKAEEERDATFTFRGMLAGETDGLTVTIPVLLHRLPLTTALFGNTTENSHKEMVAVPDDAIPGWGNVKLSMASTIFTDVKGGVEFLFGYPYGCLEQRISRILPMILAEDMIAAFKLSVLKDDDYRSVVQKTLDEFSAYQTDDGGFGYWKPPYRSSPFVSAYAVFTLAMAKTKGYSVDEEIEQKAVTYLENVLKGQNERATIYRYNDLAWNATDAFILYALTLYDKYQPAYATRLYESRQRLPIFGKALLLKAVQLGKGDELIKTTLTEELLNTARVEARTAYFEEADADGSLAWIHHSNVRSTAAVAQALMEVYGASKANETFIPKALEWLLRERKMKLAWRTTQDNLFVFWALSTYLQTFEGTAPDFTGKVLVNGKEILSEAFKGRTTQVAEQWVLLDQLTKGQNNPVEFTKDGAGRLYYTAALTYLPAGTPEPIDAGLAIKKTMTVVKGGQGQETGTFKRGDIIRIDLTVTTPRDRLFVALDDPLPAGFKAINLGLKTSDQSLRQYLKDESPFQHSEFLNDRVVFYADDVVKGVHTVSYLVSAEHSGQFNLPPTFVSEMYTPEVFGQTGVAVVDIQE